MDDEKVRMYVYKIAWVVKIPSTAQVTSVSVATVLQQQPYQLFYELLKGIHT